MKKFLINCTLLTAILPTFFVSCTKDPIEKPGDKPGGEPPVQKQLKIVLNNQYMPAAKVDSALAIWEVNGTTKTVKLQAQGDQLSTNLFNFQEEGSGTLTVQLYTQTQVDGKSLQWEYRIPYLMDRNTSKVLEAPKSINDPFWNPRAIFRYDNPMGSSFSFLVALRPQDAYFELRGVQPVYGKRIEIVRSFHKKDPAALVVAQNWICQASCLDSKGNFVNRLHFGSLPHQVEGKSWDQYRITAYFHLNSTPAMTYEFNLTQDVQ